VAVDIFTVQKDLDAGEERCPSYGRVFPPQFVSHPEGMLSIISTTDLSTAILGQSPQSLLT
jgi:hypothetical protein